MDKKSMFCLHEGCYLVKGYKSGAIYDLISQNVYSVKGEIVDLFKLKKKNIEELICQAKKIGIKEDELRGYIDDLFSLGLGFLSDKYLHVNRIRSLTEKMKNDELNERINLHSLTCELQTDCNLYCPHCEEKSIPILNCSCRKGVLDGDKRLSLKEWKEVISMASLANCKKIRIIGGEPYIAKREFRQFIQICHRMKFEQIEVFTNGTLLDDEIIDIFKIIRASIVVPIYSISPHIHDSVTGVKGSQKKAINNIIKMKKRNINVTVFLLILKHNQETVTETINYFKKYNINCITEVIRLLEPAEKINSPLVPDKWIKYLYKTKPSFSKISMESFFNRKIGNPCWLRSATINNKGDILPCIRGKNLIAGNVRKDSFKKLLANGVLDEYWYLSKDKINICKDCEFRYVCNDCRIAALSFEGDIYSKDPFCNYDPYTSSWRKHL